MLTAYSSVFRYGAVIAPRLAFARRAWSAFLGTLCVISAPVALAQTFVSQGPSPISGTLDDVQSGDLNNGTRGTVTGAIQAVLPDPVNPNVIYIGATNGGVWKTSNGGQSWTPLTDKQVSLSVGGLAFDPTDQSRQKLYVAMGATSSGGIGAGTVTSGQLPGILYSPDGGTSWITLAGTAASPVKLQDKSLIGVAARGSTILAAADLPNSSALGSGGLFRSTDGGRTFNDITPGGPVPAGSGVTSLVSDPTRTNSFYAAVSGKGIFVSNDTGNTWSTTNKFPPIGTNQAAKLATGPGGSVVAAVYETAKGLTAAREDGKLVEVYLSLDSGATWKALGGDAVRNATTYAHLAVAIDRNNPNIVYLAGDVKQPSDKVIALGAFRLTLNPDGTTTLDSLTESGTANNTTVHPDARAFAFDAFGRLLLGTDGGLYTRTNPTTNGGVWMGLNTSTLQAGEVYAIAYDSRSHRVVVALQDTGVGQQMARGSVGYNALVGADGLNAAVNEHAFTDHSVLYYSTQNLGLTRVLVDANGRTSDPISFGTNNSRPGVLNFDPVDFTEEEKGKKVLLPFASKLVLNKNDPTKIAIGTNFVYTTTDDLMVQSATETNPMPLTKRVATTNVLGGTVSAMSYGTADKVDALLVGAPNGLFWTTSAADLVKVPTYMGSQPISVVFDYNSSSRFFAADGNDLWHLKNGGSDVSRHADDLRKLNIARPTAVEFIANNGVNALLVGGMVTDISAKSPLAAVNVDKDNGDLLPATWTSFGTNLPNALIGQLSYNRWADVLAVGTFGRGAWLLYDVTAYFDTATVLRFGMADNDSAPEARFLSNGILPSRELEKVGTGTLTIAGTTSYTGGTTVFSGTMVVNGSIASSSGLTVNAGGTLSGGGIVPATTMMGAIAPGWAANAPTTLTVNTSYTQTAGSTYRALINAAGQSDRIAVNGPASIQGGALAVTAQSGGLFAPRTTYTLLSAMGGVSGGFSSSSLSLGSAFLQPSITSDADNIYLNLTINGFLAAAQTPLQAAVGGAIDSSVYSATGDYATVLGTLANLSPLQVPSILTSLSGMNYSGFSNSMVQGAQLFMNNFLAQVSGANRGSNKLALAEACDVACDATEPAKWGV